MYQRLVLTAAVAATLATTGCDAMMALGLGAPKVGPFSASAPKVKVSGKVSASAAQVAIVAAGGGNIVSAGGGNVISGNGANSPSGFALLAAGEGAFGTSTLRATPYPGAEATFTSSTDISGRYTVEVPSGTAYKLSFTSSGSSGLTVTALAFAGTGDSNCDVDTAYHLVSAKVINARKATPDPARFLQVVTALRLELGDVSKIGAKTTAEASASFDSTASAGVRASAEAL